MSDLSDDDLDLLADLLAGEGTDEQVARVQASPALSQALADLSAASDLVTADLAELADLPDLAPPAGFDARLAAAFAAEAGPPARATSQSGASAETVVPLSSARSSHAQPSGRGSSPWPLRVAAGVIGLGLLAGVGVAISKAGGGSEDQVTAAAGKAESAPTTASGRDYADTAGLAAALPDLLAGPGARALAAPQAQDQATDSAAGAGTGASTGASTGGGEVPAAAPEVAAARPMDLSALDRLRTPEGLQACYTALELPADSRPLVLDYATWKGQPALVIVLPIDARPEQVQVTVVGARCGDGTDDFKTYARIDRP
jgi:hypothetical protein